MQQKIISPHALDLCTSFQLCVNTHKKVSRNTWPSIIGYFAKYHVILGQVSYDTFSAYQHRDRACSGFNWLQAYAQITFHLFRCTY